MLPTATGSRRPFRCGGWVIRRSSAGPPRSCCRRRRRTSPVSLSRSTAAPCDRCEPGTPSGMTASNEQSAPDLGEPTDVQPPPPDPDVADPGSGAEDSEQTIDTPDERGGTGGEQAGGAG